MADQLILVDGTQRVLEDAHAGTLYRLAVRVDGAVTRPTADQLGPAISALYGQTLAALLADRTLGGLAIDVAEGGEGEDEPTGLEVDVSREAYTAPAIAMGLHFTVTYFQPAGVAAQREAILDALTTRLGANTPLTTLTVRERVIAAVQDALDTALGSPVQRNATRPVDGGGVILVEGDQAAYHDTMGQTIYRLALAVEVFQPGADADALDATVQTVLTALRGAGSLGGLAIEVELGPTDPEVLRQEYAGPLLAARIEAGVWYATREDDPTAVA